jgi:hypothetical protein
MSRKTRRQKEKSEQKRVEISTAKDYSHSQSGELVKREFEFSFNDFSGIKNQAGKTKKADKSYSLETSRLVGFDLAKTIVLAAGIFSLELVIYWARFK